ncbi:MAG: 16S rRNA (uracil(1498)-N(3))-methyltransferase [Lentisphaeria bacterium]|nr:16S rRNA (uracil(1498)-N(3))-methyltransferase [Lentisphaeria bacterium]
MARFRYPELKNCSIGDTIDLDRTESSHLFKILRARPGETVGLLDGYGTVGEAVVTTDKRLTVQDLKTVDYPARKLHLYLAPPRRQKMDQILKEATELGVYRIVPILCEYAVAIPDKDSASRQTDLLFEACKQSGNAFLPVLAEPMKFEDAVRDAVSTCGLNVFGSPYESAMPDSMPKQIGFFVGPEGGFSAREEDAMRAAGFHAMRIGPWILRVETAAVAGIARLWG